MTRPVPEFLARVAKRRGARNVTPLASGLYSVEIATRTAAGEGIFLRVSEIGDQVELCPVTQTLHRPLMALAEVWPVDDWTRDRRSRDRDA